MRFIFMFILSLSLFSCSQYEYDDYTPDVAGTYEANVVNGFYDFDLEISLTRNNDIFIEALFDDEDWENVRANLFETSNGYEIDIYEQDVYYGDGIIYGDGHVNYDGYIYLEYTIDWGTDRIIYEIMGYRN